MKEFLIGMLIGLFVIAVGALGYWAFSNVPKNEPPDKPPYHWRCLEWHGDRLNPDNCTLFQKEYVDESSDS